MLLDDYLVRAPVSVLNGEVHNLKNRQYYLLQKSSFQIRVQTTFSVVFCQLLHFLGGLVGGVRRKWCHGPNSNLLINAF